MFASPILNLHINYTVSVAESQETVYTEVVPGCVPYPTLTEKGRKSRTHREEVRELLLQEHLQFPFVELESVPFLAGLLVEDSNHGVHGHLQLGGHGGSRTDHSRDRQPNSGTVQPMHGSIHRCLQLNYMHLYTCSQEDENYVRQEIQVEVLLCLPDM